MNHRQRYFKKKKSPAQHHKPKGHMPGASATPGTPTYVEGILQLKGKFGFVLSETPNVGDVLIQGQSLKLAMNGDRVKAHVLSNVVDGRRSGVITQVLVRARDTVVGSFKRLGNMTVVQLDSFSIVRILDM